MTYPYNFSVTAGVREKINILQYLKDLLERIGRNRDAGNPGFSLK
jgi:hypothetical protein